VRRADETVTASRFSVTSGCQITLPFQPFSLSSWIKPIGLACAAPLLACWVSGCSWLPKRTPETNLTTASRQLTQRGLAASQRGDWDSAERLFADATTLSPDDFHGWSNYAEALWQRDEKQQATKAMARAVRLSSNDPELIVKLGEMYLAQEDLNNAGNCANGAIQANPKSADAWALRGDVVTATGDLDEALASYHRALSYRPNYPRVQLETAEIYQRLGRAQRSLSTLRSLAHQYPHGEEPPRVLVLQGLALTSLNRYDEAVEVLTTAARRGQPSADIFYHLAQAEKQAGRMTGAYWATRQALAIDAGHALSQQLMAELENSQRSLAASPVPGDRI
jgi:Flp pilus assembly protein TadD